MQQSQIVHWQNVQSLPPHSYTCGYCGVAVGSDKGYDSDPRGEHIYRRVYLCSNCSLPSYFVSPDFRGPYMEQVPGPMYGADVDHLPPDIEALYREARRSMAAGSYTGVVLLCRKLLMNIAVAEGAVAGQSFVAYVEHLATQGYVPPKARGWVDHIRRKGNEANHEIQLMDQKEAEQLLNFVQMLLRLAFEFPGQIPPPAQ